MKIKFPPILKNRINFYLDISLAPILFVVVLVKEIYSAFPFAYSETRYAIRDSKRKFGIK